MPFEQWMQELAVELGKRFEMDGNEYVRQSGGEECWREMYDDGLTPSEAAGEEAHAAAQSI